MTPEEQKAEEARLIAAGTTLKLFARKPDGPFGRGFASPLGGSFYVKLVDRVEYDAAPEAV